MVQVHGEVRQPGEYSVPDDTDILGLISKAGGTTEFGDLATVRVTHRPQPGTPEAAAGGAVRSEIVDIEAFLQGKAGTSLLVLQPGDVVSVSRNSWFQWRTVAAVLRDISVVATAVFLGIRTFDDNNNN
jgi:protein involved in polysaccharide export with SLBB domain